MEEKYIAVVPQSNGTHSYDLFMGVIKGSQEYDFFNDENKTTFFDSLEECEKEAVKLKYEYRCSRRFDFDTPIIEIRKVKIQPTHTIVAIL